MKHLMHAVWMGALIAGCGGGKAEAQATTEAPAIAAAGPASNPAPAASSPAPVVLVDVLDRSSSIAGPDINNDGVRDDINKWIDAQALTDQQKRAVTQLARTFQQTLLVDANNKSAASAVAGRNFEAMDCVRAAYEHKSPKPAQLMFHLEAITANTKERALQYIKYNAALGGMVFDMPATVTCD